MLLSNPMAQDLYPLSCPLNGFRTGFLKLWVGTQIGPWACERWVVSYENKSTITHYLFWISVVVVGFWVMGRQSISHLGLELRSLRTPGHGLDCLWYQWTESQSSLPSVTFRIDLSTRGHSLLFLSAAILDWFWTCWVTLWPNICKNLLEFMQ